MWKCSSWNGHFVLEILQKKTKGGHCKQMHCSSNHEDNIFDIWSTFCQDRIEVLASILKGTMPIGAPADAPSYYLCCSAFISCWNSRNDHGDACDGPSFVCPLTSSLHGSIDVAVAGKAAMAITIRFLVAASTQIEEKGKFFFNHNYIVIEGWKFEVVIWMARFIYLLWSDYQQYNFFMLTFWNLVSLLSLLKYMDDDATDHQSLVVCFTFSY